MIVRNEARRIVTRRRTVAVGEGWERYPDTGPAVDVGVVESERAVALRSAFSRLGDECRQLLKLLFVDPPLSYDEIAAATGRPRARSDRAVNAASASCAATSQQAWRPTREPCDDSRRTTYKQVREVFVSARPFPGHAAGSDGQERHGRVVSR